VVRLWHGYAGVVGPTLPLALQVLSTVNPFVRQPPKAPLRNPPSCGYDKVLWRAEEKNEEQRGGCADGG